MKKLVGILMLAAAGGSVAAENSASSHEAAPRSWSASYTGPASQPCAAPDVPEVSQLNQRIRNVARAIEQWQDCHRGAIAALDPSRAAQHIPAEVAAAMTPAERDAAIRQVAAVHARLADARQRDAAPVIARHDAWRDATVRYVAAQNRIAPGDWALRRNEQIARAAQKDEMRQRQAALGQPRT